MPEAASHIGGDQWVEVAEFNDRIPATAAGTSKRFPATDARVNTAMNGADFSLHIVEVFVNGPTSSPSR